MTPEQFATQMMAMPITRERVKVMVSKMLSENRLYMNSGDVGIVMTDRCDMDDITEGFTVEMTNSLMNCDSDFIEQALSLFHMKLKQECARLASEELIKEDG